MNYKTLFQQGSINFILFILLALIWSGSFINIKIVVDGLPPIFCAMMRVLLSLVCLSVLFVFMRKNVFLLPAKFWHLWVAGLFTQALPFVFLFIGEKYIAPALASIINSTVTIWALILSTVLFRDLSQWTSIKVAGIIIGFMGIILIFSPFLHADGNNLIGIISITGMAIFYAIGSLINQYVIFKKMPVKFETNLFQQHVASVIFLLVTSFTFETWPSWASMIDLKILLAFLYLGLISTSLAWIIYFYLIREWGAVRAASVMYLVPILAIVWDILFLHIIPSNNELLGMFAILSGVTMIQWVRKPKIYIQELADSSSGDLSS